MIEKRGTEKMSICNTCLKKHGQAPLMHEPTARIHRDNNPGHEIITTENEDFGVID